MRAIDLVHKLEFCQVADPMPVISMLHLGKLDGFVLSDALHLWLSTDVFSVGNAP